MLVSLSLRERRARQQPWGISQYVEGYEVREGRKRQQRRGKRTGLPVMESPNAMIRTWSETNGSAEA